MSSLRHCFSKLNTLLSNVTRALHLGTLHNEAGKEQKSGRVAGFESSGPSSNPTPKKEVGVGHFDE